ncbi:2-isopropylmalate synthase [Synoicihabitans lomoniglobus]|uniref:2-isopropylmalate synthase n=1 Tax=Synoicihabitans lomoniglobus TaxID=2909285 RepID=A0AAF0I355_9BACT|nr:2-isopropylmalate synthase [Opitutaceae bacterium LMO-M01]WED65924.1 2-isopropylmalate synthase [Opitutaceae bacterium LMO-M01]
MSAFPASKYRPFPPIDLPDRQWPSRTQTTAPIWCSVDLRDGNQALAQPMSVVEKLEFFDMLVRIGFKQIEVGFPSASQIEFDFCRRLIDENRIPDDVSIQILCQCRADLIKRSCEAIAGAKNVIFHLYNSTSPAQRNYVFGADRPAIKKIATDAVALMKAETAPLVAAGHRIVLEYSPESFTSTEMDFALEICEAVTDVWQPTADNKVILNLPATVEYATPNIHADQIEWMCRHLTRRDLTIVSLHTHNDRGTGIAATELGLLAGADRVEGTLFGNGERTGNLDIVTVALNLQTQGVDPKLDFSDLNEIREIYERTTRMDVPPRSPYAGDLVFTAFSGSHQDAIKKSWDKQIAGEPWDVLYIPIDPADIGRDYKAIIRINSQSGKGGVAYILENEYGFTLPKAMHREFGPVVNRLADTKGTELSAADILEAFQAEYLDRKQPIEVVDFRTTEKDKVVTCEADLVINGTGRTLTGQGNGPINAFVTAVREAELLEFEFLNYTEHSLGIGARAQAVSYIQIQPINGKPLYGAGIDTSIDIASIKAVASAMNRALLD